MRARRRRDERGVAAVLVALFMSTMFFGLAAISVDVARWYVEVQELQKTADAAALGGVTWMPQDLAEAGNAARAVAARNGVPASAVTVAAGDQPSRLAVSVSSTVHNVFGAFFGLGTSTLTRSAVADYTGPQPMGAPCNVFGNEPPGTNLASPVGSQLAVPAGASCPRTPQFWATVHGPEEWKGQGDQFGSRACGTYESGCANGKNLEFDPKGYFVLVHVGQAAVGQPLTLQLYDPAFVPTGSRCDNWDTGTAFPATDAWNPWADTDARTRYARSPAQATVNGESVAFCNGDDVAGTQRTAAETPTVTSFALRRPDDSRSPSQATPVSGCTRQFPGYSTLKVGNLVQGNAAYKPDVARVFHQWVPLCTVVPDQAGDWYLQVRTNVALGGTLDGCDATTAPGSSCTGSYAPASAASSPVTQQTGDDTSVVGTGANRFAVRAISAAGSAVTVSSLSRMPIYANSDQSTPTFNLIRILPGAAGKTLLFRFYDVGDAAAASGATLTVLRPSDATGTALSGCTASGFSAQSLPSCSLSGISNGTGWNGQAEAISVPIPADYSCTWSSAGGCWWRIQVGFGTGTVTDATTWSASISGNPVRIIR